MERWNRIRGIAKKLIAVFVVSFLLLCVSVLSSTMLTTATYAPVEAGVIIEDVGRKNGANALWAVIIPACFFVVLSSRHWKNDRPFCGPFSPGPERVGD